MAGTFTPKVLYRAQPGVGAATLYTVPAATTCIATKVIVCNTTALSASISLSIVPSAGAAADGNRIFDETPIEPNTTYVTDINYPMQTGDFLSGLQGTAGALTVHFLGVEET